MEAVKDAIAASIAAGKWPLLLDSNENSPYISFLGYQSEFHLVEAKKAVAEVSIRKKRRSKKERNGGKSWSSAWCMRKVSAAFPGRTFWLHMANSAVNFKTQYCSGDETGNFPAVLFDCARMQEEEVKAKFLAEGDMSGASIYGKDFRVVITSTFTKEDYEEFLLDSLPLDKLAVINVVP